MKTDIFISYRRKNWGILVARAIYERLVNKGYRVFLDFDGLGRGQYESQIETAIREANDILLVLPPDSFSINENPAVFLKELRLALQLKKQIIPVMMEGFSWDSAAMPDDIRPISKEQGVRFDCNHFDGVIDELIRLLYSLPGRAAVVENTGMYLQEVSAQEIRIAEAEERFPPVFSEKLASIMPLYEGIPFFTDEQSIETRFGELEYYLAFPDDLLHEMSFSKSVFASRDENVELLFERLGYDGLPWDRFNQLLEKARRQTALDFIERKNGNFFNGCKYGVFSSDADGRTSDEAENPVLHLDLYKTDYFTHQVMYSLFSEIKDEPGFNGYYVNRRNHNKLSIFRTSLGISIIVEIPSENCIVMTRRAESVAFSGGKDWVYPSVTESVSETDYQRYSGLVEMDLCVMRGLLEELGITSRYYDVHSIVYYSMFYEKSFSQDNLTASVQLRNNVTSDHIRHLLGKDTELEVSDVFFVPLEEQSLKAFVLEHLDEFRPQALYTLLDYIDRKGLNINWD